MQKIKTTCNAGDAGSIPWSGRSPRERNGNPLQYSCLRNTKDRGAPWATVLGVAKESDMTVNEQQQQFLRHFLKFSHFLISSLVPFLKSSWSCMCASILGVLISFHWSRTSVPSLSIYWVLKTVVWVLQLCTLFPKLLWLFSIIWTSIYI